MQVNVRSRASEGYLHRSDVNCPLCKGQLVRERRRVVDRLHSLVRPIRRYRCEDFACQWAGNIANTGAARSGATMAADVQVGGEKKKHAGRVPASFVVHMVLVAAGVAFVMVYSTMEPAPWRDDGDQMPGSGFFDSLVQQPAVRTEDR